MANLGPTLGKGRPGTRQTLFGVCVCACVCVRVHMHACVRGDVLVGTARLGEKCQPRALGPIISLGRGSKLSVCKSPQGSLGLGDSQGTKFAEPGAVG